MIVFIHGGGYLVGSSAFYNLGSFVINNDVIGVIINYRLGILGFLSMENEASPGNYGLWDQSLALRWVKDNIRAFGGDPDDITISGESAGGSSVAYQSLAAVNKGLFTKGIPQSGTATSVFGEAVNPQKHALTFAKSVDCWEGDITGENIGLVESQKVVACLRKLDVSKLATANLTVDQSRFVPTVDGDFLPKRPIYLYQDEAYLKSVGFFDRSYLVTLTNKEISFYYGAYLGVIKATIMQDDTYTEQQKLDIIHNLKSNVRDDYLKSRFDTQTLDRAVVDKIMNFYDRRIPDDEESLFDMVADLSFLLPSFDFLKAVSKHEACKSWFLYFNHFPNFMKGNFRGTPHAIDLVYWHDIDINMLESLLHVGMEGQMDDDELKLKHMFSSVLTDFMKYG